MKIDDIDEIGDIFSDDGKGDKVSQNHHEDGDDQCGAQRETESPGNACNEI